MLTVLHFIDQSVSALFAPVSPKEIYVVSIKLWWNVLPVSTFTQGPCILEEKRMQCIYELFVKSYFIYIAQSHKSECLSRLYSLYSEMEGTSGNATMKGTQPISLHVSLIFYLIVLRCHKSLLSTSLTGSQKRASRHL